MAINFPDSPATNDTYLAPNGIEYIYTGTKWRPFKPSEPTIGTITATSQLNLSAGGANQNVVISPSGTGNIQLAGNAILSGTNTTIGDASTDILNVNSVATFNANVSFAANTTMTGSITLNNPNANGLTIDATGSAFGESTIKMIGFSGGSDITTFYRSDNYTAILHNSPVTGETRIFDHFDGAGTAGNAYVDLGLNGDIRMRITNTGIGIGVNNTSPASALDVNGTITTTLIQASGADTAGVPGYSWNNDTSTGFFRKGAGSIGITVGGTEEINITAAGTFELNAVSGYSQTMSEWTFNRTTNGAAIGPAAADVFTTPSSVVLEASSVYEIEGIVYFLKTTAGTVTWNPVFSAAPTFSMIEYTQSPVTGLAANLGATLTSLSGTAYTQGTATTVAILVSATGLTTGVNHFFRFRTYVRTNTACNWRLRATSSAGTITPLAGSYYSIRKVATSTGTFAA